MDKFGLNYQLVVQSYDGSIVIVEPPFTVEFDITRTTLSSANVCQIRVYNLSLLRRNQLRWNSIDFTLFRSVLLRAGYGTSLVTIFTGSISQAWSVREGVNYITQIECFDGGFAFINGSTDAQFPAGIPQKAVIQSLAASLPHTKIGAIGDYPGTLSRGNTYSGNTTEILTTLTGGGFFIDNGEVNALGTNEYKIIPGGTLLLNAKSGLLGTPVLENTIIHFDMLFEPSLIVGSKIRLESLTEGNFNGDYKVTAVKHHGLISGSVASSVITTGQFFYSKILTGVL